METTGSMGMVDPQMHPAPLPIESLAKETIWAYVSRKILIRDVQNHAATKAWLRQHNQRATVGELRGVSHCRYMLGWMLTHQITRLLLLLLVFSQSIVAGVAVRNYCMPACSCTEVCFRLTILQRASLSWTKSVWDSPQ